MDKIPEEVEDQRLRRYGPGPADSPEARAARESFDEDHSLGKRSWGRGRDGSIPKTHGVTGRNFID